jgi:protein-disulfide isomerase
MKQLRPRIRPGIVILGLVLILAVLVGAACAPSTPAAPSQDKPAQPASTANAPAAEKAGPVAPGAAAKPSKASNLPMGVDADGNFYRGDPKAPVKLIEFSDFQ